MNTFTDNLSVGAHTSDAEKNSAENKPNPIPKDFENRLSTVIEQAAKGLRQMQADDGHWVFELEADATIPAEYILLNHFTSEIDPIIEKKIAVYLRERQADHGGWPLYHDGNFDISASVKAYFALKLAGEDIDAPHMVKARAAILNAGGAAKCNVFTRITLALFGQVPWRAVPVMPVEIMHLPKWFFFHFSKISYWSRTVIVPLLILMTNKHRADNPLCVDIRELFLIPPEQEKNYLANSTGTLAGRLFLWVDKILRLIDPLMPRNIRAKGIEKALDFINERLNGEDGLGGIFPAMANTVMVFHTLGIDKNSEQYLVAKKAIDKLLVIKDEIAYCQPCLSPIWDTALSAQALLETGDNINTKAAHVSLSWLQERQELEVIGDWADTRPDLRPGGWAFQYWNSHYPDVDDTSVAAMSIERAKDPKHKECLERAAEWIIGMQSKNGGWGSFDADNTHYWLNHIPFADHGALLDPPTVDVSARCIGMLIQLGYTPKSDPIKRGVEYLRQEQEDDGSWFGRWGTNYVYGTWSALCALQAAGEDMNAPYIRKAVGWLTSRQRPDGGWGEDGASYWHDHKDTCKASTPSQTSWALLGLMAAGEVDSKAVKSGVEYLLQAPRDGAKWEEEYYNAVGFPRVFYLRYHGYSVFFPLWALSRFRNLSNSNTKFPSYGI
ncbi:MAG: squalene--hopene cyclase [Pseudomonadota bacterium]|nr:squalene--hopene cyclase [Pseudomonadota bacterium]